MDWIGVEWHEGHFSGRIRLPAMHSLQDIAASVPALSAPSLSLPLQGRLEGNSLENPRPWHGWDSLLFKLSICRLSEAPKYLPHYDTSWQGCPEPVTETASLAPVSIPRTPACRWPLPERFRYPQAASVSSNRTLGPLTHV